MAGHTTQTAPTTAGQRGTIIPDTRASRLIGRWQTLKTNRSNWEQQWQEVLKFTLPHKAFVTRQRETQGQRVDADLFDSTGRRSNQILAAGFHGNLTNPSARWFRLRIQEQEINALRDVKSWLADTEDRMFDVLNGSNFTQQIHQAYLDLGSVGTSTLFESEDPQDLVRFLSIPIEEIVIDENASGRVDTIYRLYHVSVRQAFERWGMKSGSKIIELFDNQKFSERVTILHTVQKREFFDPGSALATNLPIASVHIELDTQFILSEGGFNEFPFFVTRFSKVSGDPYGYSPGIILLPDMKMLNAITKTIIKGAQKIVDPPLVLPHDGFILPLKTIPGGINYKTSSVPGDKIEPIQTNANIPVGLEMQNQLRTIIREGYFSDLFLTLADRRNMTATEVAERVAEKMVLLGPTLGRLQTEMLNPIIERTFLIMARKGQLLPAPEILIDRNFIIEYVSPLAIAQRRQKISSIGSLLQLVGGMAQFDPTVTDKINTDKVVDESAEIFGVDPDIILDDEQVLRVREARQAQQQAQAVAQAAAGAAQVAKTASEANKADADAEKARADAAQQATTTAPV